jgi:hypothetical protein
MTHNDTERLVANGCSQPYGSDTCDIIVKRRHLLTAHSSSH